MLSIYQYNQINTVNQSFVNSYYKYDLPIHVELGGTFGWNFWVDLIVTSCLNRSKPKFITQLFFERSWIQKLTIEVESSRQKLLPPGRICGQTRHFHRKLPSLGPPRPHSLRQFLLEGGYESGCHGSKLRHSSFNDNCKLIHR